MAQSTRDRIEGALHEAKGAVKAKVGEVTNSPQMQAEGTLEKLAGKLQKKIGDAESVIEKHSKE